MSGLASVSSRGNRTDTRRVRGLQCSLKATLLVEQLCKVLWACCPCMPNTEFVGEGQNLTGETSVSKLCSRPTHTSGSEMKS
jgi:hypothetical protein